MHYSSLPLLLHRHIYVIIIATETMTHDKLPSQLIPLRLRLLQSLFNAKGSRPRSCRTWWLDMSLPRPTFQARQNAADSIQIAVSNFAKATYQ